MKIEIQKEVVIYLSNGLTACDIAKKMGKSTKTIEAYILYLLKSTSSKNSTNLVASFLRDKKIK